VCGNAAHGDRVGRVPVARGQDEIEQRRGQLGVVEKQLEEVPQPIQQQRVRRLRLQRQILLHHRRVGLPAAHGGGV
jgi:hypothetical protein